MTSLILVTGGTGTLGGHVVPREFLAERVAGEAPPA